MLDITDHHAVRVLRMAHGKVNALDVELLGALRDALDGAERDHVAAVVLTGSGTCFSAGLDLFRLVESGTSYVNELLPLLNEVLAQWFQCPRPVVAAINGHAIAGGAILAWCADVRIMSAGPARIGIPELKVGVPFPLVPLEISRFAGAGRRAADLIYRGATLAAEDARAAGLVDDVVAPETLLEAALSAAAECAALSPAAFRLTKEGLRRPTLDLLARDARAFDERVVAAWGSTDTAARVRAYLQQTLGRTR
jgi:enoyl-CoA hydratase